MSRNDEQPGGCKIENCETEFQKLHQAIDTITQALNEKIGRNDVRELQKEIATLDESVTSMGQSIKKLFAKSNEHNTSLDKLGGEVTAVREALSGMSEGSTRANDKLEYLQKTQDEMKSDVRELRGDIKMLTDHLLGTGEEGSPVSVVVHAGSNKATDDSKEQEIKGPWYLALWLKISKHNPILSFSMAALIAVVIYLLIFQPDTVTKIIEAFKTK